MTNTTTLEDLSAALACCAAALVYRSTDRCYCLLRNDGCTCDSCAAGVTDSDDEEVVAARLLFPALCDLYGYFLYGYFEAQDGNGEPS